MSRSETARRRDGQADPRSPTAEPEGPVGPSPGPSDTPNVRRAVLADVPTVERLLRRSWTGPGLDVPSPELLRLVLTHVALDAGELWVAETAGRLVAAVAAVPPRAATPVEFEWSLRLDLPPTDRDAADSNRLRLPVDHWLVLGPSTEGGSSVALLRRALAALDRRGLPAVAVAPLTDDLWAAGFRAEPGRAAPGVLLRPPQLSLPADGSTAQLS